MEYVGDKSLCRASNLAENNSTHAHRCQHERVGGVWNHTLPASGWFDESCEGAQIKELEVKAAIYALRSFVEYARNQNVQLISNSLVTVHVVGNLKSPHHHYYESCALGGLSAKDKG